MGIIFPPPWIWPPPPDPVLPGSPCINCWGSGKPFGDGDTPSKIQVTFSGIQKGPNWVSGDEEPYSGTILMVQYPAGCSFTGYDNDFLVELQFTSGNTYVLLIDGDDNRHFEHNFDEACSLFIPNDMDDHFAGGSCQIVLPEIIS